MRLVVWNKSFQFRIAHKDYQRGRLALPGRDRYAGRPTIVAVVVSTTECRNRCLAQAPLQRNPCAMPNTPQRLEQVFQVYDPPLYFITFNTHHRRRLLANEQVHQAFIKFVREGERRAVCVGRYVIMPDHVHLFVRGSWDSSLAQWVRLLKRNLSKSILRSHPHWQQGFFDHVIRRSESYAQKWDYVCENPVRAGLVTSSEEWPWQGEIVILEARRL
jgi:putative transposase